MSEDPVKTCSHCPLCKFTRNSRSDNFFYRIARKIQNRCPECQRANEGLYKDFQKSKYF